ncbi:MAG: ATP-binding cassette domain-containing protein [Spirochaetales bacterium]|nr:ATP-binding cassette domain-containing protein [Spirochaetales bacterium]
MRDNGRRFGVSIRNLKFSYELPAGKNKRGVSSYVLDLEELDIHSGGCHVILGPNGCGKTTLLKLIAGLITPTEGHLEMNAKAVLVHQRPYLLSGTVYHNVSYGLRIRKTAKHEIEQRVLSELENWGLLHLKDRSTAKLSGGEKQRTAIARAMVIRPDILLLDEPTASVDPDNISQMEELINRILTGGTTVILSTHHLDFAYRMADSIFRLRRGRPVQAHENILTGQVTGREEFFNIFETEGTKLFCPGRDGHFRRAVFSENDVILSKELVKSSARNVLAASVEELIPDGSEVIVRLRAGFSFKVRISGASARELDIRPGCRLYAMLKSSSIGLY